MTENPPAEVKLGLLKTTPKVFRMFFNSGNIVSGSTVARPLFDVSSAAQQFSIFQQDKAIHFFVENFKISNQSLTKIYSFLWENAPGSTSQHVWSSSSPTGLTLCTPPIKTDGFLPSTMWGYQILPNMLQPSMWQFAFVDASNSALTTTDVGSSFIFSLVFYQEN